MDAVTMISNIASTGADSATMFIAYVLWRHEMRIQTLERGEKKGS